MATVPGSTGSGAAPSDATPQQPTKMVGEYTLVEKIGMGSFAAVYRGALRGRAPRSPDEPVDVAIKAITRTRLTQKLQAALESEIEIMEKLRHPNIVRLVTSVKTKGHIYIVMEYCGGGDLHRFINKRGPLSHEVTVHFMRELAAGLEFLYSKALVHRDLKPQNLLLSEFSPRAALKIADFGFARHLSEAAMGALAPRPPALRARADAPHPPKPRRSGRRPPSLPRARARLDSRPLPADPRSTCLPRSCGTGATTPRRTCGRWA